MTLMDLTFLDVDTQRRLNVVCKVLWYMSVGKCIFKELFVLLPP